MFRKNPLNESFDKMFATLLENDESKWRYFDTSFTSLKNALCKFLKDNNIYYELSGEKADYHFAIDCTNKQAQMINDFIDENSITEVKESCEESLNEDAFTPAQRRRFVTKLTKALMGDSHKYSHEEANDIAMKRADETDSSWNGFKPDMDALINKELSRILPKEEYKKEYNIEESVVNESRNSYKPIFADLYEEIYELLLKGATQDRLRKGKTDPAYKGVFASCQLGVEFTKDGYIGLTVTTNMNPVLNDENEKTRSRALTTNEASLEFAEELANKYGLEFVKRNDTHGVIFIPENAPAKHPFGLNDEFKPTKNESIKKHHKKMIKESIQEDGAPFTIIEHGDWGDPEIFYDNASYSYYDVMDYLWTDYEESEENPTEDGFDEWITNDKLIDALDTLTPDLDYDDVNIQNELKKKISYFLGEYLADSDYTFDTFEDYAYAVDDWCHDKGEDFNLFYPYNDAVEYLRKNLNLSHDELEMIDFWC